MGITCKQMPIEAHWAVGKIERAHAPLRRAYDILWKELGDRTGPETVLQMAVKALNDTAGPDGLVPTLLVFGAYPRIDARSPPSPEIQERAKAVQKAMKILRKHRAEVDVNRALNTRNGPYIHDILTLPLRTEVLVWREKEGWTGPYEIAAIEGRTVRVDTPNGPKEFRVTQIKPFFREEREQTSEDNEAVEELHRTTPQPHRDPVVTSRRAASPEAVHSNTEDEEIADCIVVATRGDTPHGTPTAFLTTREQENYDLAVKLRRDGVITTSGAPFQESDAEEINNLAAQGAFKFVRFDPNVHGDHRIFKTRLVREVKGKNMKPYEKSRLVVQGYGNSEKEQILTQSPTI